MNQLQAGLMGYLLGALPIGYIVVRVLKGTSVNILKIGSGRIGATNAWRAAGPIAGIVTLVGDLIKGGVAILLVRAIYNDHLSEAIAGVAVILGHNASIFVWLISKRFEGGAGATTFSGGATVIWPPIGLFIALLTLILLYLVEYSSVTSTAIVLSTLIIFTVRALQGLAPWSDALYALGGSLLVIYALRPNYQRLREGAERKVRLRETVNRALVSFVKRAGHRNPTNRN